MRFRLPFRYVVAAAAAIAVTSCNAGQPPAGLPAAENLKPFTTAFKTPAVVAYDSQSERLEEWPMRSGGGDSPQFISPPLGIYEATAMVADGYVVTIAEHNPPQLVSFDVSTGATTAIADHLGNPIDLAIDRQGIFYALHADSVGVFHPGSSSVPQQLTCSYISEGEAVAVDNEGDVFVNGYGLSNFTGVVEYPSGSSKCVKLSLKHVETAYLTGIGVDPKTDNLIVEYNPQLCAGGEEGEITVYSRPYGKHVVAHHNLHSNCPGAFRLNAASTKMFFSDGSPDLGPNHRQKVCEAYDCIDQRSYPDARDHSLYVGGSPTAVTTIPNSLPN